MIIPNQTNIKVHFAGVETIPHFIAAQAADVKYQLFSVFKLIAPQFDISSVRILQGLEDVQVPGIIDQTSRHCIMDSGLFSLMFGSYQRECDEQFLDRWLEVMVEFIHTSGYKGTVVEMDVQKVFSVEHAWKLRRKLKKRLPDHRIISVFHIEDGQRGLDRMIEFSDYIAVSIPELRILKKTEHALKLTTYIKEKRPELDIHLLGCTQLNLLRQMSFCTSSDSTSWHAAMQYGRVKTIGGNFHVDRLDGHKFLAPFLIRCKEVRERFGIRETSIEKTAKAAFIAQQTKHIYAETCGNQQ